MTLLPKFKSYHNKLSVKFSKTKFIPQRIYFDKLPDIHLPILYNEKLLSFDFLFI